MKKPSDYYKDSDEFLTWRWPNKTEDAGNVEAQAAIERFLEKYTKMEPRTARERAERRGLKVIEGGRKP